MDEEVAALDGELKQAGALNSAYINANYRPNETQSEAYCATLDAFYAKEDAIKAKQKVLKAQEQKCKNAAPIVVRVQFLISASDSNKFAVSYCEAGGIGRTIQPFLRDVVYR